METKIETHRIARCRDRYTYDEHDEYTYKHDANAVDTNKHQCSDNMNT